MANKNQILVFIVSFLIVGFFLLSIPEAGFSGVNVCCLDTPRGDVCADEPGCTMNMFEFCTPAPPGCPETGPEFSCTCLPPPPEIPTLNQWGMFILAGVLGLFAVIGLFVMRRSGVVKAGN